MGSRKECAKPVKEILVGKKKSCVDDDGEIVINESNQLFKLALHY